ncbi:MAG: 4Fe-4S dicluster domain-containing protein [Desulfamplus sp.]|nr:4Fe-4S dicluster domain-containing protein [Desulfamplus sp.]
MEKQKSPDIGVIKELLNQKKNMKFFLSVCVGCGMCAESCFLYVNNQKDPSYMPSFKVINSLGRMYKKKGELTMEELGEIKSLVWEKCVLCTRCHCPMGISIPAMIAWARTICRSQGISREYGSDE